MDFFGVILDGSSDPLLFGVFFFIYVVLPSILIIMSRVPSMNMKGMYNTLLCVGGPEHQLPQDQPYSPHAQYLPNAHQELDAFIHTTSSYTLIKTTPDFKWHGLMGYTPSMIRLIGPDPHYPNLSYNLGCNGVGILPSIYAGKRIGNYLAGHSLKPSIFDTKFMNNTDFLIENQ